MAETIRGDICYKTFRDEIAFEFLKQRLNQACTEPAVVAKDAYRIADAMIAERDRNKKPAPPVPPPTDFAKSGMTGFSESFLCRFFRC